MYAQRPPKRRRRDSMGHRFVLPNEMLAAIVAWTDNATLGRCLLASRDLYVAALRDADDRRFMATSLCRLARDGRIDGLVWARRRATATGREHFRFGASCFLGAASAGRTDVLSWLYDDQAAHALPPSCSATQVLCAAAESDRADVVMWMLDTRLPLCSIAHALDAAAREGASGAFLLLWDAARDASCVPDGIVRTARGPRVLDVLLSEGLLGTRHARALVKTAARVRDVESIEWVCANLLAEEHKGDPFDSLDALCHMSATSNLWGAAALIRGILCDYAARFCPDRVDEARAAAVMGCTTEKAREVLSAPPGGTPPSVPVVPRDAVNKAAVAGDRRLLDCVIACSEFTNRMGIYDEYAQALNGAVLAGHRSLADHLVERIAFDRPRVKYILSAAMGAAFDRGCEWVRWIDAVAARLVGEQETESLFAAAMPLFLPAAVFRGDHAILRYLCAKPNALVLLRSVTWGGWCAHVPADLLDVVLTAGAGAHPAFAVAEAARVDRIDVMDAILKRSALSPLDRRIVTERAAHSVDACKMLADHDALETCYSAVERAAGYGSLDTVVMLAGADLMQSDGWPACHACALRNAAHANRRDIVGWLMARLPTGCEDGPTAARAALHALEHAHTDLARWLLSSSSSSPPSSAVPAHEAMLARTFKFHDVSDVLSALQKRATCLDDETLKVGDVSSYEAMAYVRDIVRQAPLPAVDLLRNIATGGDVGLATLVADCGMRTNDPCSVVDAAVGVGSIEMAEWARGRFST